jgi:DNA-nicking Smr family endonuclease
LTAKKSPAAGRRKPDRDRDQNFSHRPFQGLTARLQQEQWPPLTTKPSGARLPRGLSDEQAYRQAMQEVQPLSDDGAYSAPWGLRPEFWPPVGNEDWEALAQLTDLVAGRGDFDLSWSDEYVEGQVAALNPRVVAALKAGAFPIQDWCDLHGLNVPQARARLESFLAQAGSRGLRTVLVVHGRGHRSPGRLPVLKNRLTAWLTGRHFRRLVLAFATAQAYDGGPGALYILLRETSLQGRRGKGKTA